MFERYTEGARRVIFYAYHEASTAGSPYIESEQLLLGILREDKAVISSILRSEVSADSIRSRIEAHVLHREPIPKGVDLPLSKESKRILLHAAEEADRLGDPHLGPEHLLLGLLCEETSFSAALLQEHAIELPAIRKKIENRPKQRNH